MTPRITPDHDAWLLDHEQFERVDCPRCRGRGCFTCSHTGGVSPDMAQAIRAAQADDGEDEGCNG